MIDVELCFLALLRKSAVFTSSGGALDDQTP
jgi:hypothetical protein